MFLSLLLLLSIFFFFAFCRVERKLFIWSGNCAFLVSLVSEDYFRQKKITEKYIGIGVMVSWENKALDKKSKGNNMAKAATGGVWQNTSGQLSLLITLPNHTIWLVFRKPESTIKISKATNWGVLWKLLFLKGFAIFTVK